MKKIQKRIAVMLSMVMLCTVFLPSAVYASELGSESLTINNKRTNVNTDVVYVDDEEGNIVPVEITETIYYNGNSGIVPMDFSPKAKVGERRTYTVKISNEAMGVPSLVGGTLSFAAKKKAVKVLAKAIAKKLGSSFIPGLNFVSWALGVAAFANAVSGKAGISVTVGLKYTRTYLHKEGYYVYGWSPTSLSVRRY
nr:hypothetical protein [uncultured Mogibacterium sp.]